MTNCADVTVLTVRRRSAQNGGLLLFLSFLVLLLQQRRDGYRDLSWIQG
jgi:hypothetical protein